jgi:hypothetical protein
VDHWTSNRFGNLTAVFTIASAVQHSIHRKALSPFFSKRSINKCEILADEYLIYICESFIGYKARNQILNLKDAGAAFSGDMITEYSFGFNYDHLRLEDFKEKFQAKLLATAEGSKRKLNGAILHCIRERFETVSWQKVSSPFVSQSRP